MDENAKERLIGALGKMEQGDISSILAKISMQMNAVYNASDTECGKKMQAFIEKLSCDIWKNELAQEGIIAIARPFWWYKETIEGSWYKNVFSIVKANFVKEYAYLYKLITDKTIGFDFTTFFCRSVLYVPQIVEITWENSENITIGYRKQNGTLFSNNFAIFVKQHFSDEGISSLINSDKSRCACHRDVVVRDHGEIQEKLLKQIDQGNMLKIARIIEKNSSKKEITSFAKQAEQQLKGTNIMDVGSDKKDKEAEDHAKRLVRFLYVYKSIFKDIKKLYFIPSKIIKEPSTKIEGVKEFSAGGMFILSKDTISDYKLFKIWLQISIQDSKLSIGSFSQKAKKEVIEYGKNAARATIMSREDSHNIGSHVLASLRQIEIKERALDVERLMNYIQQRWDFIAGVISGYPKWSEPLFFFSDLLKGFFDQGLLLDYIVKDDGVLGDNIEFHIKHKNGERVVFKRKLIVRLKKDANYAEGKEITFVGNEIKRIKNIDGIKDLVTAKLQGGSDSQCDFEIEEIEFKFGSLNTNYEDFLINIPGGIVGCHSFYCILENIMRNAAKYCYKRGTFQIFIDIENDVNDSRFFLLSIHDNCSKETEKFRIKEIQDAIGIDIVNTIGVIRDDGWGIEAIKLGSEYLGSPHRAKVEANPKIKNGDSYLSYEFKIQKPRLVAVADFNSGIEKEVLSKGIKIKRLKKKDELGHLVSEFSPQLLVILPDKQNAMNTKDILQYLCDNHYQLPARILLCGKDEDHKKQIKCELNKFEKSGYIPKRRCFVGKWFSTENKVGWEDKFIINAYREWVWRFADIADSDSIHLVVFFERHDNQCFERWQVLYDSLSNYEVDQSIKISIYGRESKGSNIKLKVGEDFKQGNGKNYVTFDNHSKIGDEKVGDGVSLKVASRHYHPIGNDNKKSGFHNREAFNVLQNISSGFSGIFFLLLLIESALTKVLILDERIVESVLEGMEEEEGDKFLKPNKRLYALQLGGCFVPFFLRWPDSEAKCLVKRFGENAKHIKYDTSCKEGLCFDDGKLYLEILKNLETAKISQVDFIIIHKGVLETHVKKDFVDLCNSISPRLIIASGRGPRGIRSPFLEYSVLQQFVVREFSKCHLSRILFSVMSR